MDSSPTSLSISLREMKEKSANRDREVSNSRTPTTARHPQCRRHPLRERGLIDSITSENLRIIILSWFRQCGHKTVALIGAANGRVGDPLGKFLERRELYVETREKNSAEIRASVYRILQRHRKEMHLSVGSAEDKLLYSDSKELCNCFVVLNNFDWWRNITLLDFLKEVGRYARVESMIAKESVKKPLLSEEGMSHTEFTYQLLQVYNFLYMFKNMGVNVQIGGSDQWENIITGTELIRKILQMEGAYELTSPLLLQSNGSKFRKSEDGAIWLSAAMLSPYKFYQYFFSVHDVDVRFMKILTFLSI